MAATSLDRVRAAFAAGVSPSSAALLLQTRDAGYGWEELTEAVSSGLSARHGRPMLAPVRTTRSRAHGLLVILSAALLYVVLRPVLGLGHELVVATLAQLFQVLVGTGIWEPAISLLGIDPIYAGAAIRAAGGVHVAGFAVAGPVGQLLSNAVPAAFVSPEHVVDGAGISMVAVPGSPAIGRGLAAFGADVLWLAIGLWLVLHGRTMSWRLAVLGVFIQAQIAINHLLDAQVSLADVDASGLPFAIALAVPDGDWFTSHLNQVSPDLRDMVVSGALVGAGYVCAILLVVLASGVWRIARRGRRAVHVRVAPASTPWRMTLAAVSIGFAVVTAWSPVGALAVGQSNWRASAVLLPAVRPEGRARGPFGGVSHTVRLAGATRVEIRPTGNGGWQYLVDGLPDVIRGVGYNPQYAALPQRDRRAVYGRDFANMRGLGINTIEGWFEGQFDSVTLDAAATNGIGVLMPFELNQDWPYEDPNVQQSILDHVSAYVERYKKHPAVRMWAPGNENLHRILYARWVSQENVPAARARADAFAAFLPRLVDRIHELDPEHPVVYRDAEDVYLGRVSTAFSESGGDRPWLIYGANVYSTPRLQQIVAQWPAQWSGRALLISEFAPGGVGPSERPIGFQQQWSIIRSRPDVVLGGIAYTWATNGPEDLDRVFGLVDQSGIPTDAALAALSGAFLGDTAIAAG